MNKKQVVHCVYKRHIDKLIQAHPDIFNKENPKALKVGIHVAVSRQHKLHPGTVSAILACWTSRLEYRSVIAAGGSRYDLKGNIVSQITVTQQEHAVKSVAHTMKMRSKV